MSQLNIQCKPEIIGASSRAFLSETSTFTLKLNTEAPSAPPQGTSPPNISSPLDSNLKDFTSPPAPAVIIDLSTTPVIHTPEFSSQEFFAIAKAAHHLAAYGAF